MDQTTKKRPKVGLIILIALILGLVLALLKNKGILNF